MPTIKVPESVELVNSDDSPVLDPNGKPVKLDFVKAFILDTLTKDPKWGADSDAVFACIDIKAAFKGKKEGDEVLLSQACWEKMKEIAHKPSSPYNIDVMSQAGTFFTAIKDPFKS